MDERHSHETEAENQAAEMRWAAKEGRILAHWKTMVRLLQAVTASEFEGIKCGSVEGENWFDLRDKIVNRIEDDGERPNFDNVKKGSQWRVRCGEVWTFKGLHRGLPMFDDGKGHREIYRHANGMVERDGTLHNFDVVEMV